MLTAALYGGRRSDQSRPVSACILCDGKAKIRAGPISHPRPEELEPPLTCGTPVMPNTRGHVQPQGHDRYHPDGRVIRQRRHQMRSVGSAATQSSRSTARSTARESTNRGVSEPPLMALRIFVSPTPIASAASGMLYEIAGFTIRSGAVTLRSLCAQEVQTGGGPKIGLWIATLRGRTGGHLRGVSATSTLTGRYGRRDRFWICFGGQVRRESPPLLVLSCVPY